MLLPPTLTFILPALPSRVECPPSGPGWIHEIKHDGYRMMLRRDVSGVRLLTRNGKDWTGRFLTTFPHRPGCATIAGSRGHNQ